MPAGHVVLHLDGTQLHIHTTKMTSGALAERIYASIEDGHRWLLLEPMRIRADAITAVVAVKVPPSP